MRCLSESLFSECKPDCFCCRCMCGSMTPFTLKLLPWDLYLVSQSRHKFISVALSQPVSCPVGKCGLCKTMKYVMNYTFLTLELVFV